MKSLPANENPYPEPQPYDIEDALNRVEGDIELFDEIVEIFLDECPKMMAEIQASIELGTAHPSSDQPMLSRVRLAT